MTRLFWSGAKPGSKGLAMAYELVVKGGLVVDGTGAPPREADVAVSVCIASSAFAPGAARVIDARGLVVAPGFVDG